MALNDTLNIRSDEVTPVSLLVFQSVFLGLFLGAFDVGANTLFLSNFSSSMIPRAIVISGITGIVLTSAYSFLQSRLKFSTLALVNLFTVFAITFLLRAGYYFSDTKWLAFGLFVLMGPLNIIALVGFWGTVGRMFDLRQGKRIFGFIDTGQVIGIIISSFSVPFLVNLGFKPINLLYISATSIFLAFVVQLVIGKKYANRLGGEVQVAQKRSSFGETMRIPYVRTMAAFVIISMFVAFFVHYLFLAVSVERFESPDEMAKFFGGLMGSLTFVSVLIKAFVYGPLIKNYGLKVGLLVSPVVMLIITLSAAFVGTLFGYTIESATFTFFFLLISLSKFFQKALRDSIDSPLLKLMYQSLSPSIRHGVQARVDGTINELAALASGIALSVLGLFSFIGLIHYAYVLIALVAVWLIISLRLFYGYRKTLEETLTKAAKGEQTENRGEIGQGGRSPNNTAAQLDILERTKPWLLPEEIKGLIVTATGDDLVQICGKIKTYALVDMLPYLESTWNERDGADREAIAGCTEYLQRILSDLQNIDRVKLLVVSKAYEDRAYAAACLGASSDTSLKLNLTFLLRDLVPQVKRQAIWASRGSRSRELITFLVDFLDKDDYAPLAHAALRDSGEIGLEMLGMGFNRSNASDEFRSRILRIIPETGSVLAQTFLFEELSVEGKYKRITIEGLTALNFMANDRERIALSRMLIQQSAVCAWNLNALYHCPPASKVPYLKQELETEYLASRHLLFMLLKLEYNRGSIDAVVENLELGTGESISFALELLDTFMNEDIKPYIFPLLEDVSLSNRLWALQSYFPLRAYPTTEELLKAIMNRSDNLIGKQAKIFALNAFKGLDNLSVSNDLAAQLFNTDRVLRLLSAQIVQRISSDEYQNCRKRLDDRLRVELDRLIAMDEYSEKGVIGRLSFYRELGMGEDKSLPLFWLYNASVIKLDDDNLMELGMFKDKSHLILIEKGGLTLKSISGTSKSFGPGDILSTQGINPASHQLTALASTVLHFMDSSKVTSKVYDYQYLTCLLTQNP